ncbi:uncharacterized protein [Amphiura filiformis]|uniref:uncharacterized protein n=1 Tax=Amphiura filiformis TaxID=82378 RepID=UPI003B21AD97
MGGFLESADWSLGSNLMTQKKHAATSLLSSVILWRSSYQQSKKTVDMVSQDAMTQMFTAVKLLLPPDNRLPDTWNKAYRMVAPDLIPVQHADMCPDDHVIFTGQFAQLDKCPKKGCGKSRYSDMQKKIPVKKLPYLPLLPRIKRLLEIPRIKSLMILKQPGPPAPVMRDVWDAPMLAHLYQEGAFGEVCKELFFGISIDGFDPFSHNKLSYSMTPVIMTCLNFPPEVRHKLGYMLLSTIIPGPSAPKDMNCALQLLVDELVEAGSSGEGISVDGVVYRAKLALGVFDFPGCGKVIKGAGSGSKEHCCRKCLITGTYYRGYGTVLYAQNRRFLPENHVLRNEEWGNEGQEQRERPETRDIRTYLADGQRVQDAINRLNTIDNEAERKRLTREVHKLQKDTGKKGLEEFARLPEYKSMQVPVDPMHTVQVFMKKMVTYFQGRGITWDSIVNTEHICGRHMGVTTALNPWTLTQPQKQEADIRLKRIKVPAGFDWNPCAIFGQVAYMKSIVFRKLATHGMLQFALRGMLGEDQRKTFFNMCVLMSRLLDYTILRGDMEGLSLQWAAGLAEMERDFPLGIQTILVHQMQHLPDDVLMCGPSHGWSMFAFERYMSFLRGRIHNRKDPEISAVESYRIFELCQHMIMKGKISPEGLCDPEFVEESEASEAPRVVKPGQPLYTMTPDERAEIQRLLNIRVETSYKLTAAKNVRPRLNKYSCREKESRRTISSYIARTGADGQPQFGQIIHFVAVGDERNHHTLAKVEWMSASVFDEESLLWKARTDQAPGTSFVQVLSLPPPLVTAVDDNDEHILWFLSFNPKYCT